MSISGQVQVYRDEVFNFLKTCTIKFSPWSYIYGEQMMLEYGYTEIDADWNPYYHNLCGEYQSYNTPMYVYSKEDQKDVLFERALETTRPNLFNVYKIPSNEYKLLCKKYPDQVYLIRSILYPVDSVQTCIDADELSLLAYDATLLYEYERDDLVTTLKNFLNYVRDKWWNPEFCYEDLYCQAFYYMLWQALPNVLFAKRVYNIFTPYVHPYHVWEYLISKGMNDYRNILSYKQSLWLYRNFNWLNKNKGKTVSMLALDKYILGEMSITLYGKDLVQQTEDTVTTCKITPEVISNNIATTPETQLNDAETTTAFNARLYDSKLEVINTPLYTEHLTENLTHTKVNSLTTKYLEMHKNSIYTMYEDLLLNFLIESTVYRYIEGQIDYTITISDPVTNTTVTLSMGDMLAFLYYVIIKSQKQTPTLLPTKFSTYCTYNKEYPKIPNRFTYLMQTYKLDNFINVDGIMATLTYTHEVFRNQNTFSDYLTSLFTCLLRDIRYVRNQGNDIYIRAMKVLYNVLRCEKTHTLNLSNYTTYEQWFSHNTLLPIIEYYDSTNASYSKLLKIIVANTFPITKGMADLVGSTEHLESLYSSLSKLFVQLCSYDVTFLDTSRETDQYIIIPNIKMHMEADTHNGGDIIIPNNMIIEESPRLQSTIEVAVGGTDDVIINDTYTEILDIKTVSNISINPSTHSSIPLGIPTGLTLYFVSDDSSTTTS